MRIKSSITIAAAVLVALSANACARALNSTNSVGNDHIALAGRAPIEIIPPEPKPEPEPEPEPAPAAPGSPGAHGGAPKVSAGPAHLSIPETGLPKPTPTQAKTVAPTATKAESVTPSPTGAKPVAPTEPAPASGNDDFSTQCKRGLLSARCTSDHEDSDDSEPIGAPPRAQPADGSWYQFVGDPSKVQNARTQFNLRVNNPAAADVQTGTLSTYVLEDTKVPNDYLVDTSAAGIGSILTALGRRGEIEDGANGFSVSVYSRNPPPAGQTSALIQTTTFTEGGKMIIAESSNAAADGTLANEGKMPWDQLVFLQYKQLRGGETGKLSFIGRAQIENKATLNTMLDVFEYNGRSTSDQMSGVMSIKSVQDGATAGGPESQAFDALSWSDNVNGVYWLLSDFHNSLGNKHISQFHLRFNNPGGLDLAGLRQFFNQPNAPKTPDSQKPDPSADILIELAGP